MKEVNLQKEQMMTVRKRRIILKKLNAFFENQEKILTEIEYKNVGGTPVRLALINKFFFSYDKMVVQLKRFYKNWEIQAKAQADAAYAAAVKERKLAELKRQAEKAKEIDEQGI